MMLIAAGHVAYMHLSDAALLVAFAVMSSLASAECLGNFGAGEHIARLTYIPLGQGIDSWAFVSLGVSVFGSIVAGYVLGRLIVAILWIPLSSSYIKGGIIISIGYAVFYLARYAAHKGTLTAADDNCRVVERASWSRFGHRFRIEPLLVCMVASCAACNATSKRRSLTSILHNSSLYVFLPFFTLSKDVFAAVTLFALADVWLQQERHYVWKTLAPFYR